MLLTDRHRKRHIDDSLLEERQYRIAEPVVHAVLPPKPGPAAEIRIKALDCAPVKTLPIYPEQDRDLNTNRILIGGRVEVVGAYGWIVLAIE
jgi:hypothetical protein